LERQQLTQAAEHSRSAIARVTQVPRTIKCKTCFQTFQGTTSQKMLTDHAANKHSKQFADCFNADEGQAK
jgi:hypothetical protein